MAAKFVYDPLGSKKKEEPELVQEEPIEIPHMELISKDIKFKEMPKANEAFLRNEAGNPSTGVITMACGADDSPVVCAFKADCPRLKAYDDFIYSRLEKNEVIAIEVRWCGGYEPRNKFTNFDLYKDTVKTKTENSLLRGDDDDA